MSSEAMAAITLAAIANANATLRPSWKGAVIRCGKNWRPATYAAWPAGRFARRQTGRRARSVCRPGLLQVRGSRGERLLAGTLAVEFELRCLPQDRPLQCAKIRTGLDAKLTDQVLAVAAECIQRVSLPSRAVQRHHELCVEAFAVGAVGHERLEFGHQLTMVSQSQPCLHELL